MNLNEQIVKMHQDGKTKAYINRKLKTNTEAINQALKEANIPVKKADQWKEKFMAAYERCNGCHSTIAREFNVSREYVRQILSTTDLKATGLRQKTVETKNKIVELVKNGKTTTEILNEVEISRSYLVDILHQKNLKPAKVSLKKYTEEGLIALYQKHKGNYQAINRELGVKNIANAFRRYGLSDKFPGIGRFKEQQ